MTSPLDQFFFDEIRRANAFLIDQGYEERTECSDWQISVEYESESIEIKYTFGDRDSHFNTTIRLKEKENREYGLWEWVDALGSATEKEITGNLVSVEAKLETLIQNSADCLKANLDQILKQDKKVLEFMDSARDEVRKAWEAKWK